MGVRDALLLNTTGSNFQALQTDDTARLKGDLSLQKDDGTEVLGIDVSAATLNLSGGITGSGNISSSLSSTGSFGRVVATTFHGDGSALKSTLPRSVGIVTQSAQLAAQISGAFTAGFEMSASISGSATSTGSFGRVEGEFFFGDGSGIKTTIPRSTGLLSSSKQIASNISGSFNKGFEFTGILQTTPSGWDSWATHQPLITGRAHLGGKGNRNAAIAAGGVGNYAAPHSEANQMGHYFFSGVAVTCTEEWNGTSWTEVNDMIDASSTGYGGTTEAGYAMGRLHPLSAQTEEWNGTNWSEGPNVNAGSAGRNSDAGGCSPSQIYLIGGYGANGNPYFTTFDGSSFTAEPNMPNVRHAGRNGHSGNASSALAWGSSCYKAAGDCTNLWNGSAWSEVAALPKIIDRGTGAGTVNDSYAYGGRCATEAGPAYGQGHCDTFLFWNGTSWSEQTDIPTPSATGHNEAIGVGAGSSDVFIFGGKQFIAGNDYVAASASLMYNDFIASASFGRLDATTITGDATPIVNKLPFPPGLVSGSSVIESDISGSFNKGFGLTGNITTPMDAWSTGHDMNTGRYYFGAKGYVDAAFAAGGGIIYGSPYGTDTMTGVTELWDGTSWTEVNDMTYGRTGGYGGTVEAGYFSGGGRSPWSRAEEWDGSTWSEATAFGERNGDVGGCSPTQVYSIGSMYDGGQAFKSYNTGVCTVLPSLSIGTCVPFGVKGAGDSFGHAGNADCLLVFTCGFTEEYNGSSWSVLSHNDGEYTGRYTGFTNQNPNPAKLNGAAPNLGCTVRGNTGAGTTNDAYSYGGEVGPISGPAFYQNCHTAMFQRWDGTSWSRGVEPPDNVVNARGVGDGSNAFVLGGRALRTPAYVTVMYSSGSMFLEGQSSASFGLLTFVSASGNARSLQSQLPYSTNPSYNVLTGSANIAANISGSFTSGFEFSGRIRPSTGGIISLGDTMIEAQTGATGGSMNKGTAFVAGGVYGTSRETCACHQQYNGTSWSEAADLNDARKCQIIASGDSNAAIVHGGPSGPATLNGTEEWNGSAWSEVNTFYPARNVAYQIAAAGESSEAALRWGVYDAAEWNGTNWSEFQTTAESGLEGNHYNQAGTGTSNAALQFAGQTPHNFSSTGYDRSFRAFREYNGSNWSECPILILQHNCHGTFGSSNDAVVAGGNVRSNMNDGGTEGVPFGSDINHSANYHPSLYYRSTYNEYWNGSSWSITGRLLCKVIGCNTAGSAFGGPSGAGVSNQGFIAGGITPSSPYTTTSTQLFNEIPISGSFGRLVATTFHGDGSGLTNVAGIPVGMVSGSAQLGVSGSFTSGFGFNGEISGSLTSTGSFGRIEADFLHGDASSISSSLSRSTGIVSGAIQIAADISGSFTSGFEYDGTIQTTLGGVFTTDASLGRTARFLGGLGAVNAGFAIAGQQVNTPQVLTEEYNGTSFSEGGELPAASRDMGTAGTVNAGFIAGGQVDGSPTNVKALDYDGSSWTETTDLPSPSCGNTIGAGETANAALFGVTTGFSPTTCRLGHWHTWNGSNWSSDLADLNDGRYQAAGGGSPNAAMVVGGSRHPEISSCSEIWNGSSWSTTNGLLAAARYNTFAGTTNDALHIGGYPNATPEDKGQIWDGTSWSETANLISGASYGGGGHAAAASGRVGVGSLAGGAHKFGGGVFGTPASELFTANISSASFHNIEVTSLSGDGSQFSASLQSQLLTSVSQISNSISGSFTSGFDLQGGVSASFGLFGDAWSIGGAVIDRSRHLTGFGTVDAAIKAGGANVNTTQATLNEEWNGALWSEIADMPAARKGGAGAGSANAGLYAGGDDSGYGGYSECSEVYIWNGLAWVETLDLPNGTDNALGHGFTQDSALVTHGAPQYQSNNADEWDGTTWTEKTANISSRGCGQGGGGANAAHIVGGLLNSPFAATTTKTECWNGSAWSEESNTTTAHFLGFYAGITNDAHVGLTWGPPNIVDKSTEIYNGISWAVTAPVISGTGDSAASGRTGVGTSQGGTHRFGGGVFGTPASELFNSSVSTGSLGQLRGTVGGEIKTDMFNITSSTFKLPLFSDADLNYWNKEPEESTGSISGSVVRVGDVNVLNKPGTFFFHSDYNALGFTYVSASVYSQSIDFRKCGYASGSFYTASSGFVTQSHYCYHNVIQYITGSYT